jgi:hypothetical protein
MATRWIRERQRSSRAGSAVIDSTRSCSASTGVRIAKAKDSTIRTLPQPCQSCPWVTTNTARDIPRFSLSKAEGLAKTCPDAKGLGPDFFASIFACHLSAEGADFPCAGWLAAVGRAHPQVRLMVIDGALPSEALDPGDGWPELHTDFQQVIHKLRRTA